MEDDFQKPFERVAAPTPAARGAPRNERAACPSGYPVDCGDFCCESGYSCATDCRCLTGKPHICAESNRSYVTVQDAGDGDCPWQSVDVCGAR